MLRAALVILVLVVLAAPALADVVELKTGQRVEGTLKQATPANVSLEVGGRTVTFSGTEVRAIYFGTAPPAHMQGAPPSRQSPDRATAVSRARASSQGTGCYESSIVSPTPFMGNDGEIFKLADGSLWEVKYEYEYLYEYYPDVIVCPSSGKLVVEGKTLNVQQIAAAEKALSPSPFGSSVTPDAIESRIDGAFSGWEGETIFKLQNGQIWQQTSYAYTYHYAYSPEALIYKSGSVYKLRINGVDGVITVTRLK